MCVYYICMDEEAGQLILVGGLYREVASGGLTVKKLCTVCTTVFS